MLTLDHLILTWFVFAVTMEGGKRPLNSPGSRPDSRMDLEIHAKADDDYDRLGFETPQATTSQLQVIIPDATEIIV